MGVGANGDRYRPRRFLTDGVHAQKVGRWQTFSTKRVADARLQLSRTLTREKRR